MLQVQPDGQFMGAAGRALGFKAGAVSRTSAPHLSDEDLITAVARRDPVAMHMLYLRHHVRIFRFARRLVRSREAAEDVVSQVFLDVWRSADAFEHRSRVSTWLLSIARFKAFAYARKVRNERIDDVELPEFVDDAHSPETAASQTQASSMLRSCIDKLPAAQRVVIDLVYYHERTVAEAAEVLGIPCGTVKTRMFHARRQLAALLHDAGIDSVPVNFAEAGVSPAMQSADD